MKKIIVIISILFGLGNRGMAQQKGDVEFGANLGVNFAAISQNNNGRSNSNFNMNAAVFADCYFSNQWSVKAKLIYDRKGGEKINVTFENNPDFNLVTDFKLDYITIPLMINGHLGETRKWNISLGPYVGFLISAEESKYGLDIEDEFHNTDWGITFGLGYKIPISDTVKLFFEYDGQSSIKNISKYNKEQKYLNTRSALNVGVGIKLK